MMPKESTMLNVLLLLSTFPLGSSFVIAPLTTSMTTSAAAGVVGAGTIAILQGPMQTQQLLQAHLPVSSFHLAVSTVDPTAILSDLLGSFVNSPAILAIPIVAALLVAFLIAFAIQAYANPQVEDDE